LGTPSINVIGFSDQQHMVGFIPALGLNRQSLSQECCLCLLDFWILIGADRFLVDFIRHGSL